MRPTGEGHREPLLKRILVFHRVTAMKRRRYVGPIPHLSGKTAAVWPRAGVPGQVMAQFEEQHLKEARDWWQFPEGDFQAAGPDVPRA